MRRGALAEEGPGEVGARIAEQFVRQQIIGAPIRDPTRGGSYQAAFASKRKPGNRIKPPVLAAGEHVKQFREGFFAGTAYGIVHIGPPQMIGVEALAARTVIDASMAGRTCGPPITLIPTATNRSSARQCRIVLRKSRSTLPSIMRQDQRGASAAARLSSDNGKRALRGEVMVGLISNTRPVFI